MSRRRKNLPTNPSGTDVDAFLRKVAATPVQKKAGERGRLIFAMDATASREPTWDRACHLQAMMFSETDNLGGLDLQLCYYRGYGEFETTAWLDNAQSLQRIMSKVRCAGGLTQLEKVLRHATNETGKKRVNAVVFVGDCMEEDIDKVCHLAGELGLLGLPVFMFHEGNDPAAGRAFREIARLSGGAYCSFDASSAQQLRDLLSAVAVFAAGGRAALEDFGRRKGDAIRQLTHQIKGPVKGR